MASVESRAASIAAMPKLRRPIVLALILAAASGALAGCGNSGPEPSIPNESARTLLAKITEVQANVDVGSCLVAADKTDELIADVDQLPSSVNDDVRRALDSGANHLKLLLSDPSQCQSQTATTTEPTTTQETTTEETTTERTQPTTTTTPTQTQPSTTTTPTQTQPNVTTTGGSGGIGPGGL
jgi:DNA mismatch repair ATPase MutL